MKDEDETREIIETLVDGLTELMMISFSRISKLLTCSCDQYPGAGDADKKLIDGWMEWYIIIVNQSSKTVTTYVHMYVLVYAQY